MNITLTAMQQDVAQAYRKFDNVVLLSPTGSGKTLAYMLPLAEQLRRSPQQRAVVIVPSRELAVQTTRVAHEVAGELPTIALYGGRPTMTEHRTLREVAPRIIVATPGRLLDHLGKGNIEPTGLNVLIIDEFDKCLEMGFRREMADIFSRLPNVSKRMLLSATDKEEITQLMPEYHRLDYLDHTSETERLEELRVDSPEKDKLQTLSSLLVALGQQSSIVFVGFRESVERVTDHLLRQGFHVAQLHGGLEQRERERQLFLFQSGTCNILVATDLASRGLDIAQLDNVIHYHLPPTPDIRTHRNGRTARWDQHGRAFYIVGPEEDFPSLPVFPHQQPFADSPIPEPRWQVIYIGKGRADKISRGDIAGFLMKVGGLARDEVGRIEVLQHQSYAAVLRTRVAQLLPRLRGQKIKGIRTLFEVVRLHP